MENLIFNRSRINSIQPSKNPVNESAHTHTHTLFSSYPFSWTRLGALVNRLFRAIFSLLMASRPPKRNGYFVALSNETNKRKNGVCFAFPCVARFLRNGSIAATTRSTAANTPRLIRFEGKGVEFSLHPSLRAFRCRLIACQCLAIFGVSILRHGTNEAKERRRRGRRSWRNRGKVFLSLFPREESTEERCSRGESVKEDSFLVRGARTFSTNFSLFCVFSRTGHFSSRFVLREIEIFNPRV